MEKQIVYVKVYIKSEADLPKEDGIYFVCYKRFGENATHYYRTNLARKTTWLDGIDWYLQPREMPSVGEINEYLNYKKPYLIEDNAEIYFCFSEETKESIIRFYKWLLNKILGKQ